ncbi:MAG TPA: hypothetical protein VGG38_16965 [Acidimicrobiales bacterium]
MASLIPVLAVLVVVVVLVAVFMGARLSAAAPTATVTPTLASTFKVDGTQGALSWAATGQSAIAVPSVGINVASGTETAAPIASLTKIMTAYIILRDHPLGANASGPKLTMTQADVNDFNNDTVQDEANAQVNLGEILTERQLLGGMLVHSANNFADTLAVWDAGSVSAFVAKMNRTAQQLGMDHTQYADPSGFSAASVSTASDLLKVAVPDMANPAFASLVQMPAITLPVAGEIASYTPLLGVEGVIGVKSGFTSQAGGGDILAVVRRVHGFPTLVISAVTGQEGPNVLYEAGLDALELANETATNVGATTVISSGQTVARVTAAGHTVSATVRGTASVLSWPGIEATRRFQQTRVVKAGTKAGTRIGSEIVTAGTQRSVLPVYLQRSLPPESTFQRVF